MDLEPQLFLDHLPLCLTVTTEVGKHKTLSGQFQFLRERSLLPTEKEQERAEETTPLVLFAAQLQAHGPHSVSSTLIKHQAQRHEFDTRVLAKL